MASKRFLSSLGTFALLFSLSTSSFAQRVLKAGNLSAAPGEKKSGFLSVPGGADGPEVQIPVTLINGSKSGPMLALTAGVHGYEYVPILALQRLGRQLNPARLSGSVIIVPVVNVPSFFKRTIYYNPYDWKNQNRVFPGRRDGSMTERIAYQLTQEVLKQCDYHVDLHCGDGNEDLESYLYYTETGNLELDRKTKDLAIHFGFKIIVQVAIDPKEPASLSARASLLMGKPALTVECGRLGRTDEEDIQSNLIGCFNTMKHIGMIEGSPDLMFEPVWIKKTTYVMSEHDGIFYPLGHRGLHVQKGELLGYLTDFSGNVLQKAVAPHDGIIMFIIATPPLSKGEPMVKIGGYDN